jgi:hypothetical protein
VRKAFAMASDPAILISLDVKAYSHLCTKSPDNSNQRAERFNVD